MTMDMDSSYIECFIQDWIEHFHETMKYEEKLIKSDKDFYMPFVAIPGQVITAIFKITDHLELGVEIRYLTIHLYDKFMCNYFWEVYKDELSKGPTEDSWSKTCEKVKNYSKLYLVSCLQLATKMVSHSKSLGISQALDILSWIDSKHEYAQTLILYSEFKVFKTVGFKIPLCIPLHCIEVLLAATNLKNIPNTYDVSLKLLDLAYFQHDQLYSHLHNIAVVKYQKLEYEKKTIKTKKTNVLLLSASIIVCTTFFIGLEDDEIKENATKLGEMISINDRLIMDMANILLVMGIQEGC